MKNDVQTWLALLPALLLASCTSPEPEPRVPASWQAEPADDPVVGRPGRLELVGAPFERHHAGYSFARERAVEDVRDADLVLKFDWEHPEGALAATGDRPSIFVLRSTFAEVIAQPSVRAGPPVLAVAPRPGTVMIVRLRDESLVLVRLVDVTPSTDAQLTAGGKAAVSFEWAPFPARPVSPPDPLPPGVTAGRIVLAKAAGRAPMLAGYSFRVLRGDRFDPDLSLYWNDGDLARGAIVAAHETPELHVLGPRTWPELARLTALPTTEPVRQVPLTTDLVGVALLVKRRGGQFALVRVTAVRPATFAEVNAGKGAALEFEWAPFTPAPSGTREAEALRASAPHELR